MTRSRPPCGTTHARWLAVVYAVGFLMPATAISQTAPGPAAEADPRLDEIIVTARKTEESVQDIPMSAQVLSADFLDKVDLTRLIDLQFNIPGLVVSNLGLNGAGFSLRGISDQGGSSQSVASHLNGVYLGTSNVAIVRMFDLERVEVLKGPQGTLYGRNATGGSINFIARSPAREFSADIETAYGSFNTARMQGHVNIPFGSGAFRFAYIGSEGDGFIRNSVDDRKFAENDFWGLRASLLMNVSEKLSIGAMAQHVADDGASGELWLPQPAFLVDPSDIRLTTVTLANPFLKTDNDFVSVKLEYDLGNTTLRGITGYARSEVRDVDDCFGMPNLRDCVRSDLPRKHDQWSQEFQLVSQRDTSLDWIAGIYYYDGNTSSNFFQLTPVFHPTPTIDRSSRQEETAYAAYGQAAWHINGQWGITAGLRLSDEVHRLSAVGSGRDDSPTPVSAENDLDRFSWRLDLEYALTDLILAYGGVSTGFRSGGITYLRSGALDLFGAEELIAYEAGIKSQWLDRRATLNTAAFYYDFSDLQVSTTTVTSTGPVFETDNAARAEVYGIDTDGTFHVSDRLTVMGSAVWVPKREFVEYRDDQNGDIYSGNKLTRAPEWTATAAIDYRQPVRGFGNLSARLEYNYRTGFFYTTDNVSIFSQDSFGLLNLFLTFESSSGKWYVFASGRNLGNVDYFNQVFLQSSPGYPDTYELGFGYRFQPRDAYSQ